jgi:hypothetical protein
VAIIAYTGTRSLRYLHLRRTLSEAKGFPQVQMSVSPSVRWDHRPVDGLFCFSQPGGGKVVGVESYTLGDFCERRMS